MKKMKYTSAVVNSSDYNFYIYWNFESFTLSGRHGFSDEDEILEDFSTAEEVVAYLKTFIKTWCFISITPYETIGEQSRLLCHQVFREVGDLGDKGTSLVDSMKLLQMITDSFDEVVVIHCLLKLNIIL